MFGFGPSLGTVFQSRWKALTWALCMLVTAYCTVPFASQTQKHETAKAAKQAKAHKSPWSY